ncbi:hypothetical protein [Streptomyces sp. NPDC048057]|uniref:hypothetical protein n=1 Tax=Streptomyces sp. NPDC048057 TaxID=3155628 RepID=UPI0033D34A1A
MKTRSAAVSLAALAAVGASALPAQADGGRMAAAGEAAVKPLAAHSRCMYLRVDGYELGRACYSYGILQVKDSRADGLSVSAEYRIRPGSQRGKCTAPSVGTKVCNLPLREGDKVSFRVVAGPYKMPWTPFH